jgi:tetratricopeptide (TPR) repeat protein
MPRPRPAVAWLVPAVLLMLLATPALACLWDYDTLRDERRGLPGVAEILAGKWERHSDAFYRHRIASMEALLAKSPNDLAAYDNLAVAHDKLGEFDKAIEVILRKDKLRPGEYTTHANLGTFDMHKGDLENGIEHIERALAINPDAHFGREEYQLMLAKYLRDAKASGGPPPLEDFLGLTFLETRDDGKVEADVMFRGEATDARAKSLRPNVVEGITGIIRFGPGTSPHLFYALGNVLTVQGHKHLAYRAYDRAVGHGHPHAEHIKLLQADLKEYISDHDELSDEVIARERAEAAAWVQAFQQYEDGLIRDGKDVDDEASYAAFYEQHGSAVASAASLAPGVVERVLGNGRQRQNRGVVTLVAVVLLTPVVLVLGFALWWRRRSRRRAAVARAGFAVGAAAAVALAVVLSVPRAAAEEDGPADGDLVQLFDGKSLAGWVTRDGNPVTKGWAVEDGAIVRATHGGGDIYTAASFEDFDLSFEWKITAGVNSGVKYRVREYDGQRLGPEYQIIDETADKPGPRSETGSLYALYETAKERAMKPPGEWNHARIVARGTRIEHWLNGVKLLDADTASEDWAKRLADSKFARRTGFATGAGPIMLTDHAPAPGAPAAQDKIWFRNLTVRQP